MKRSLSPEDNSSDNPADAAEYARLFRWEDQYGDFLANAVRPVAVVTILLSSSTRDQYDCRDNGDYRRQKPLTVSFAVKFIARPALNQPSIRMEFRSLTKISFFCEQSHWRLPNGNVSGRRTNVACQSIVTGLACHAFGPMAWICGNASKWASRLKRVRSCCATIAAIHRSLVGMGVPADRNCLYRFA